MNIVAEQSTIPELIRNIVANIHPEDHTFLIHKVKDTWVEISYKQALEKIDALSAWFLNIGIKKDLGRGLRGKTESMVAVGADPTIPDGFETPFKHTAAYLGLQYKGCTYYATEPRTI